MTTLYIHLCIDRYVYMNVHIYLRHNPHYKIHPLKGHNSVGLFVNSQSCTTITTI